MERSRISRTLRQEAAVPRVAAILSRERFESRSALGRRVCAEFSFIDARGRPRLSGCLRVTVGTPAENDAFLSALSEVLA